MKQREIKIILLLIKINKIFQKSKKQMLNIQSLKKTGQQKRSLNKMEEQQSPFRNQGQFRSLTFNMTEQKSPQNFNQSRYQSPSTYMKKFIGGSNDDFMKNVYNFTTNRKNVELNEKNDKLRDIESKYSQIKQKLVIVEQEYRVLKQNLDSRTEMYKKMLSDQQKKANQTIDNLKQAFRIEFNNSNKERAQVQQFYQRQSQIHKNNIALLERQNEQLKQKLSRQIVMYNELLRIRQKLQVEYQKSKEQYEDMKREKNDQIFRLQESLAKNLEDWKKQKRHLNEGMASLNETKQTQFLQLKEKFETQLKSLQNLRQNQNLFKDNEISELKKTLEIQRLKFANTLETEKLKYEHLLETENIKGQRSIDEESRRLYDQIVVKQRQIDMLQRDITQLKSNMSQSIDQNSKLKEKIDHLLNEGKSLSQKLNQSDQFFNQEKSNLIEVIAQLKEEIRLNQVNFVRERDNNEFLCAQNLKLQDLLRERQLLLAQIKQLRLILLESSAEIENCRNKFLFYERENKKLLYELQKTTAENNSLLRIRRQLEQQAVKWRQNYMRAAR